MMRGLSLFHYIGWGYRLRDQELSDAIVMPP